MNWPFNSGLANKHRRLWRLLRITENLEICGLGQFGKYDY